jgi:hypothetical protein
MTMRIIAIVLLLSLYTAAGLAATTMPVDSTGKEKKKRVSFFELPIITYSPETSLRLGAMSVLLFRFKNSPEGTHLSQIKVPITYTLQNQAKFRFSYTLFLPRNKHLLDGHIQWLQFPLYFYGIGPGAADEDEEIYTTRALEIEFNYLARLNKSYYLGFRFNREDSQTIEFEEEGQLIKEGNIPGADGAVTSALGLMARLDRRDNVFNPGRGPFLEVLYSVYDEFGGRHLLGLNAVGERIWGQASFERLALLGGDQIMRGHYEGRYRDNVLMAAQVEYRFPLFRERWIDESQDLSFWDRWGMVAFAGLGNVAPEVADFEFNSLKKSFGFGIRYLAKPEERLNIRLDLGFGTQKPGFYFNIKEAF